MKHKNKDLPEVGSKWVALVDEPQLANVKIGEGVVVKRSDRYNITYSDGDNHNWVADPLLWHKNFRPLEQEKAPTESTAEALGKIASDGGPSEYYDFPSSSTTLNDLIEHKGMSFAQGNIFKAAYRLGNKEGISLEYDLKKIKYYADRMLNQIKGDNNDH